MNYYNHGLEEEKAHKLFSHVFGGDTPPLSSLGQFTKDLHNNYSNTQIFNENDAKHLFDPEGPRQILQAQDQANRTMAYSDDPLLSSASHANSLVEHTFYGTSNLWDVRGFRGIHHQHDMNFTDLTEKQPMQLASELETKGLQEMLLQKKEVSLTELEPPNDAVDLSTLTNSKALSHKRFTSELLPLKKTIPDAPSGWWDSLGNLSYMAEKQENQFDRLYRNVQPLGSAFTR